MKSIAVELYADEFNTESYVEYEGVDKFAVRENGVLAIRFDDGAERFYADGVWRSVGHLDDDDEDEGNDEVSDAS